MSIYFHFVPFFGLTAGIHLNIQMKHSLAMSAHHSLLPQFPHQRPIPRYSKVWLVDDDMVNNFISETMIMASFLASEYHQEKDAKNAIKILQQITEVNQVPDIIFIDIKFHDLEKFNFFFEFSLLPEFIRNKCKIVLLSNSYSKADRMMSLMNPSVLRYMIKPLDLYQFKEFVLE